MEIMLINFRRPAKAVTQIRSRPVSPIKQILTSMAYDLYP